MRDLAINGGVTYAERKYRDNLVGADGQPLTNALFQLPGRQISNAPKWTVTGSVGLDAADRRQRACAAWSMPMSAT